MVALIRIPPKIGERELAGEELHGVLERARDDGEEGKGALKSLSGLGLIALTSCRGEGERG